MLELSALDKKKQIILVKAEDKETLSRTFVRFQEHYESPCKQIRGKIFTLGMLKRAYSNQNGAWTYVSNDVIDGDWSGFNFPSPTLDPFKDGLFDPLTQEEQALVEAFRHRSGPYYVIGVYGDGALTIDHEIAHALYSVNPKYRKEVDAILDGLALGQVFKILKKMGYCKEVFHDETHAYCGVDGMYFEEKWVKENKEAKKIVREIGPKLRELFERHKP